MGKGEWRLGMMAMTEVLYRQKSEEWGRGKGGE